MRKTVHTILALAMVIAMGGGCSKEEEKKDSTAKMPSVTKEPIAITAPFLPAMDNAPFLVQVNDHKLTMSEAMPEITMRTQQYLAPMRSTITSIQELNLLTQKAQRDAVSNVVNQFIAEASLLIAVESSKVKVDEADIAKFTKGAGPVPSGMPQEELTQRVKIAKFIEAKMAGLADPPDIEIKKLYDKSSAQLRMPESVEARHILIKIEEADSERTKKSKRKKIEKLRKELVKGEDFAKLARKNSDCPSGQDGGKLKPFGRKAMVKEFEDAAFSQKIGVLGPVVETAFGFHIIEVLARNKEQIVPLEQVRPRIVEFLKYNILLDALRNKLDIKYGKEYSKAIGG